MVSSYSSFFLNKKACNQAGQIYEEYTPKNSSAMEGG